MKNWNSNQNIRPKKGICSYLVNFYRVVNTIYTEYVYCIILCIFLVSLCFLPVKLWNELHTEIMQLKI